MFIRKAVICEIGDRPTQGAVRLVVVALTLLFLNHCPLIVQIGLAYIQRAHPIRFQVQRQIELIRRQFFKVIGSVLVGRPIHRPTVILDEQHVLPLSDIARTLEHHMLE